MQNRNLSEEIVKINVDRLCTLAGVAGQENRGIIRESANYSESQGMTVDEIYEDDADDDIKETADEMIEIDEVMLVQELRRAKKMMLESKQTQKRRNQNLLEAELKTIVESEVENIMKELNLNSGWVYGDKRPTRSRQGYTHQGSYLKGIGFK